MSTFQLNFQYTWGTTNYAMLVRDDGPTAGQIYTSVGPVYQETLVPANVNNYAISVAEAGGAGASGIYQGTIPSTLPNGVWLPYVRQQVGGSKNLALDYEIGAGEKLYWNGSEVFPFSPFTNPLGITIAPIAIGGAGALPNRAITFSQWGAPAFSYTFVDANNNPYSLVGHSLNFVVFELQATGSGTWLWEYDSTSSSAGAGSVGISNNIVTVSFSTANTQNPGLYQYILWDNTLPTQPISLVGGSLSISPAVFSMSET
jgi:hypothetical protein